MDARVACIPEAMMKDAISTYYRRFDERSQAAVAAVLGSCRRPSLSVFVSTTRLLHAVTALAVTPSQKSDVSRYVFALNDAR